MQDYSSAYSQAGVATDRSGFIVKTYLHLLGAIMAFVALEVVIFASGLALPMAQAMMNTSWLLVLGGFMMVSWIGSRVAQTAESKLALVQHPEQIPYLVVHGRRGGSALCAAALNALAREDEL